MEELCVHSATQEWSMFWRWRERECQGRYDWRSSSEGQTVFDHFASEGHMIGGKAENITKLIEGG